jgi:ABC-type multidrug transport system ATPase subunit
MDSLGFPTNWVWRPIVILAAFVVFFFAISTIGLAFVRVEMSIARARTSDTDLSAGKEKMTARSISEVRAIDLSLENFALGLDKRTALGRKLPTKTILNPVNATFQSGLLNIIMGPSGSGKTSLLNAVALRLHSTLGTKYRPSGNVRFNGAIPSNAVIRSVCSYVCQDDDALLPSLTVRETLRFAAGLRLPSWMSKDEKYKRAEEVLLKMGLKDCADNLVGSDLIKGISGGEKRRVTIAVQILTDPRILLLDEPTSGLDAFTASSIMEVLQGLAMEGRTLILTIHQARSDLFKHFGNVLLLARGGSPVYSGAAKDMLGYFGRHGFECPPHTNPADYALDLITIDLQQEQREQESREKVKALIKAWEVEVEKWGRASMNEKTGENSGESRLPGIQEVDEESPDGKKISEEKKTTTELSEKQPREDSTNEDEITEVGDTKTLEEAGTSFAPLERQRSLIPAPRQSFNKTTLATPAELGALVRKRASFAKAFPILMHRSIINLRRQPPLLLARTMQVLGLAIVFTLFFAPLASDFYSVQNRMGFVQEVGAFYFVGMLQNVAIYPADRDVFYREDDDGVYSVEAFISTYTVLEFPFELVSCLLFGVLADLVVGFPRTVTMYFVCVFSCFGVVSCGESLGIMFNTLFNHTGFAVNLTSIFLSVANTMGGVLSTDMPKLFVYFNYLSPIRYATRAMATFSLHGQQFTCDDSQRLPDGKCFIETGEQVLDLYNLNVDGVINIVGLAVCLVVYRLVAWVMLRAARTRFRDLTDKRRRRET